MSSIVFRTGVVDENGQISINAPTRFITAAEVHRNPSYEKRLFERKLRGLGVLSPDAQHLMDQLGEQYGEFRVGNLKAKCVNSFAFRRDIDRVELPQIFYKDLVSF